VYLNLNHTTSIICFGYLKLNHLFRIAWNSARNFPVLVLQLSILGTCTWTRYFTVSGIQVKILLYLNLSQAFWVPVPQSHISRLQKLSPVCHGTWTSTICLGYLKLNHLFSGTWTSASYFMNFFWVVEKSDDFLKQEGNFSYVTDWFSWFLYSFIYLFIVYPMELSLPYITQEQWWIRCKEWSHLITRRLQTLTLNIVSSAFYFGSNSKCKNYYEAFPRPS
jgi:hypothetical protein